MILGRTWVVGLGGVENRKYGPYNMFFHANIDL